MPLPNDKAAIFHARPRRRTARGQSAQWCQVSQSRLAQQVPWRGRAVRLHFTLTSLSPAAVGRLSEFVEGTPVAANLYLVDVRCTCCSRRERAFVVQYWRQGVVGSKTRVVPFFVNAYNGAEGRCNIYQSHECPLRTKSPRVRTHARVPMRPVSKRD